MITLINRAGTMVIPTTLRPKILALAHEGHPGMTAMKSILRERVWWPRMTAEVEEFVSKCEGCALTGRPEKPVPMQMTKLPDAPWDKLAIDYNGPHAAYGARSIVVMVDYYSRFLTAEFVKSTDFASLAPFLKRTFGLMGNPVSIRSDNGPPFNGRESQEYCANEGITPEYSTPANPQQNGLVERYMQLVNKAVTIAASSNMNGDEALSKAVAAHNSAKQRTTGEAPDVLLLGRRRRGKLPEAAPMRIEIDEQTLRQTDERNKFRAKCHEDKKRRARAPGVVIGDTVYVKQYQKAKDETRFGSERLKVIGGTRGDFTLEASNGRIMKRNITQLKKAPTDAPADVPPEVETRAKRKRTAPSYLSDFVRKVEIGK